MLRNYIDGGCVYWKHNTTIKKKNNGHKKNLKDNIKHNRCSIYNKVVELGKEHLYIELIEHCPRETKEELQKREGHFIRGMGTVNHQKMGRTVSEYQQSYRDNNKETLKQRRRHYSEYNKEKVNEQCRVYREGHKEQINQQKAVYRETNRDDIRQKANEKIQCVKCNVFVRRGGMARHMKTDKCKSYQ